MVLESKAKTVLRFMGYIISLEPLRICWTIILFAFSEGWYWSQNAYWSLFGHKFDATVQSPRPLLGPCPQHAILDVINPVQE